MQRFFCVLHGSKVKLGNSLIEKGLLLWKIWANWIQFEVCVREVKLVL